MSNRTRFEAVGVGVCTKGDYKARKVLVYLSVSTWWFDYNSDRKSLQRWHGWAGAPHVPLAWRTLTVPEGNPEIECHLPIRLGVHALEPCKIVIPVVWLVLYYSKLVFS